MTLYLKYSKMLASFKLFLPNMTDIHALKWIIHDLNRLQTLVNSIITFQNVDSFQFKLSRLFTNPDDCVNNQIATFHLYSRNLYRHFFLICLSQTWSSILNLFFCHFQLFHSFLNNYTAFCNYFVLQFGLLCIQLKTRFEPSIFIFKTFWLTILFNLYDRPPLSIRITMHSINKIATFLMHSRNLITHFLSSVTPIRLKQYSCISKNLFTCFI